MTKNNTTAAFAALANTDQNARTTGAGYGTDNPKKETRTYTRRTTPHIVRIHTRGLEPH